MGLCRLCYSDANLASAVDIFNEHVDPPIWKTINELSSLMINKDDPYTKIVCYQCFDNLRKFYCFRKMVLLSDSRFQHNSNKNNPNGNSSALKSQNDNSIRMEATTIGKTILENTTKASDDQNEAKTNRIKDEIPDIEGLADSNECFTRIKTEDCDILVEEAIDIDEHPIKIEHETDESCHNSQNTMVTDQREEPHNCNICTRRCLDKKLSKNYFATPEKLYSCEICSKKFSLISSLKAHSKIHTDPKAYKCDTCGKCFLLINSYKNHLKLHTIEKPFHCYTCSKSFTRMIMLRKHLLRHSGDEYQFHCDICDETFTGVDGMHLHSKLHKSNRTRHKCNVCGEKFASLEQIRDHLITHLDGSVRVCYICYKTFSSDYWLQRHLLIHNKRKTTQK